MVFQGVTAQETSYVKGNEYIIEDITVSGLKSFNEQTVITYTGLRKGDKIRIPGEQISSIISKLWKLDLFSDINFYLTNVEGETYPTTFDYIKKYEKKYFF